MFTGREDHAINIDAAAELTNRYRQQMGVNGRKGGFFGKETLEAILRQDDCVGIRYYYGLDSENRQVMVLVGADEDENDLVEGVIAEAAVTCPPTCGAYNVLNSQ